MISKKKASEIQAEVVELLGRLPGQSPHAWLTKEIKSAKKEADRDVETLEMLCAALEREVSETPKAKGTRKTVRG